MRPYFHRADSAVQTSIRAKVRLDGLAVSNVKPNWALML